MYNIPQLNSLPAAAFFFASLSSFTVFFFPSSTVTLPFRLTAGKM